ncbi:MAG: ABC transporter ATP-binding protein, partial [Planctomycetaceae bacterium]|nr:ABC transporter ATP-binding protein [Planctomycetaceae bacterium]
MNFSDRLKWMGSHWAVYRGEIPLLLGLTLGNAVVLVAYPFLLKRIIDGIEGSLSTTFIWTQVSFLFGLGVLHFFIYAVMQYRRALLNLKFEFGARLRAFEYVLRMGPEFFSRFRTGDVVTRLNDDVTEKISWFLCSGIFRVIEAAVLILFGVVMMLVINPQLTLYTAAPLPFLVGLFILTGHQLHRRYDAVQKSISELNDSLESCFSGIRVIKAFGVEDHHQRLVEQTIEQQRRAEIQAVRWQTIIDSLYGNIWQLAIVAVLLAGGTMAIANEVTLGDLIAFDTYILLLVWPMFDIGQFFVKGKQCAVGVDRIAEIESAPPEVVIPETPPPKARTIFLPLLQDNAKAIKTAEPLIVEFDQVSYQYPTSPTPAVVDVSFIARPGTITALVGEVGTGKSTLIQLIPRVMDPTGGTIRIGERDARQWLADDLRSRLGFVPQEPHLLSGTIEENIRFGRVSVTEEAVQNAIEIAQLQSTIAEWPAGLQTVVGARGVRLSGGQKQRVS